MVVPKPCPPFDNENNLPIIEVPANLFMEKDFEKIKTYIDNYFLITHKENKSTVKRSPIKTSGEDSMNKAQTTLVNYQHQLDLASYWGDGTTSSSDGIGMQMGVTFTCRRKSTVRNR